MKLFKSVIQQSPAQLMLKLFLYYSSLYGGKLRMQWHHTCMLFGKPRFRSRSEISNKTEVVLIQAKSSK